jgi:parallel beta-helix repeat protein
MFRKIVAVWVSLAMLLGFVVIVDVVTDITPSVKATTITVDDSGGADYTKIQDAIDNASDGYKIKVWAGVYYENIFVNKTLTIIGNGSLNTSIIGGNTGSVVTINASGCNVSGFRINGSGDSVINRDSGIKINGNYTKIENCNCSNNQFGIYLIKSNNTFLSNNECNNIGHYGISVRESENCIIWNCTTSGNYLGIFVVHSTNISISGCIGNNNEDDGLHFEWSKNISISQSTCNSNRDEGISFAQVNNSAIDTCTTHYNWGFDANGIMLRQSYNNNITNSTINENINHGIYLWEANGNTIKNNIFINNTKYAALVDSISNYNLFHLNNFINNNLGGKQASDSGLNNQWNSSYPSGGNFWSDYTGSDEFNGPNQDIPGNDGIGDTNYSIDIDSVDNYPLMSPIIKNIFLHPEWNLISIPRIQPYTNLESVLSSINGSYDAVQWYNVSDTSDPWKHYQILKPSHLNDLIDIDHTIGFWIQITEPEGVLFEYSGTQPYVNQSISLDPGWNMVGYPSLSNKNRTAALNNINYGSDVDAIWTFNAATQTWQEIGPTDYFELGRGYWIHSKVTKVWDVPL